ncbi:hypothetical protein CEUSTIGMA_g8841.t1 [Chlamydomonas eustigma]|uniref:dolichyl-phosphate beta-glucosyltransferase n=1 Tax=Chlamydomonas eustigma TaxID=1157962 RepID=A0A250XED4_9CHLO|nr:hypothetical protein CEUSTIGMA_g8841.t1 [Chlamydomonas eustigma]|eukprot:GAX81411.1 hypothetical protein CEUSTIGMA_g8841.t1 [Chlamydomonas eustigma]
MMILCLFVLFSVGAAIFILLTSIINFATRLQLSLERPIPVTLEDFESLSPPASPSIQDPSSKSLSIIIPAFNEQDRLGATLDEAMNYLQQRRNVSGPHFTYEVIVVDDGSRDETVRLAAGYVQRYGFDAVRVLKSSRNMGKGHAVRRGCLCSRGEVVLFMDADGATRISDLEKLECALRKLTEEKSAETHQGVVFGSRSHLERAAMAQRSALRNILTKGFHLLVTLVAGSKIRDTQCGFKLFSRKAALLLFGNQRLQRWCFDVELLHLAEQFEIPVSEVSVRWTEMPGSKIRFTSILHMAFELLTIKICYQVLGLWKVYSEPELRELISLAIMN